jgi:hypothetical protein
MLIGLDGGKGVKVISGQPVYDQPVGFKMHGHFSCRNPAVSALTCLQTSRA